MFAVVPLGVSCFLSCRVGGYFVARQNVGAQAGCSRQLATGGRRVIRARLVFWKSGAKGMGANAVERKSTSLVFQCERAPLLAAVKGLNTGDWTPTARQEGVHLRSNSESPGSFDV